MKTNFNELKVKIEHATKKCFKENIRKYGSDICAFSLISDDGAMTVVPFTNTKSHLVRMQLEDSEYKEVYEFEPEEWLTSDGANDDFNKICKILATETLEGNSDFTAFKNTLFETCVQVLEKLRNERFFQQELGTDLLILFSISDTFEPEENLIKWARRLNNIENRKHFEAYMNKEYE